VYEYSGEEADGKIIGRHKITGLRPGFWDRVRYFGKERELQMILDQADAA
jgi:pilus assembly protein CpaF